MADPMGFLSVDREAARSRPVDVRIRDWREVEEDFSPGRLRQQASRCMDCGIPFCHNGCPLGNLIPDWNDLVRRDDWRAASERLHATNNFPEFTGKTCPAPCEPACVLAISPADTTGAVTIKQIEAAIVDRAWAEGWVRPLPPRVKTGHRVAVVGSGPAGLTAAQQLTRAGHDVVVYERADRIGGLLRYGIPEFKMEKRHLDRRLEQMAAEGTEFVSGVDVGADVPVTELRSSCDAVILAGGATRERELPVPGRDLDGVHLAMDYLTEANRVCEGDYAEPAISAAGRHVVIVGGGDTGADCLGTAIRQGAASITQLQINTEPPASRPAEQPWPLYPMIYRETPAHEEGGRREFAVSTEEFLGDSAGRVRALRLVEMKSRYEPVPGSSRELPADLVLLALGFAGPEQSPLLGELGVEFDAPGNVARDEKYMTTAEGVFAAGDMGRGQSLVVWAIAEGRSAAAAVDDYLTGSTTLPRAIPPTARPLS